MRYLQRFVEAWCQPDYPPKSVSEAGIIALEAELRISFPQDYRQSIVAVGAPSPTTRLWDWITELEDRPDWLDQPRRHQLGAFHTPDEVREALSRREAGMPDDLIPFANDSAGNLFCFRTRDLSPAKADRAKVHFWDHDLLETRTTGQPFETWLKTYLPNA